MDVIGGQEWNIILGIPWLAHHNPKIDWRIGEVKMTRCPEECKKQRRLKQKKSGQEKQKEKEKKENLGKKQEKKEQKKKEKKKPKKKRMIEVKKVVEEWEIWDKEETEKLEEKAKKLVQERFHKWIHVFGKNASKQMPIKKLQNHAIDTKKGFVLRKRKVYLLSREEREKMHEFISEQLRKGVVATTSHKD